MILADDPLCGTDDSDIAIAERKLQALFNKALIAKLEELKQGAEKAYLSKVNGKQMYHQYVSISAIDEMIVSLKA